MKNFFFVLAAFVSLACYSFSQPTEFEWTPVGPGGGGAMFSPGISPADSSLMFVACDMSGAYRTSDGGASWEMIPSSRLKSSTSCAPAFCPGDRNLIWDDGGNWIYKSSDAGVSWRAVWEGPSKPKDLIFERDASADEPFILAAFGERGVYKSLDGENFERVEGIDEAYYLDEDSAAAIAASSSRVWILRERGASIEELDSPASDIADVAISNGVVYVLSESALRRSENYGKTWEVVARAEDYNRGPFRFVKAEGKYVWATTGGGGKYQPTALLSKDGGKTFEPVFFCNSSWDDVSNLERGWLSLDFSCGWGGAALGFNVSTANPRLAIWTDSGRALFTSDAGETWKAVYTSYADAGERTAGKFWTSRGLEVTSSWDIFIPRKYIESEKDKFINVAYTDIGGEYSEDGGFSWRSRRGDGIPVKWFNTTYRLVYDEVNGTLWGAFSGKHDIPGGWSANYWYNEGYGGVGYSVDYGKTWTPITEGGLPNKPVTSIAVDFSSPSDNRILYAAVWGDGVWRSTDGGENWERKSSGLDCGDGENTSDSPNSHFVEIQTDAKGYVYVLKTKYIRNNSVIKNDAGLWRSTNGGESWEFISADAGVPYPNPNIDTKGEKSWADAISFELDESDENHIYVCAQNANNGKVQGGLYETTDGGKTWTRIYKTYCAFRLTRSKYYPNRYYLATKGEGIVYSDDKGQSWRRIENFPFDYVTRISEDPFDSLTIWVNTFGGGVWKGKLKGGAVSAEEEKIEKAEIRAYPNPFSEKFVLEAKGAERIEILDLSGRKILSLNGGGLINARDLAAGVYLAKAAFKGSVKAILLVKK